MNVWKTFKDQLNDLWISILNSLPTLFFAIMVMGVFLLMSILIGRIFRNRIKNTQAETITAAFIIRVMRISLIIFGLVIAFHSLGFEKIAGGLLAGAGVGALILGLAFKEIGENFLAGIILVFDRAFSIGDIVSINKNMGQVIKLKFRTTHIKSFDGRDIYVPNSTVIRNELFNYTRDGLLRHEFVIGIDYDDNIDDALELIYKTVQQDPKILQDKRTQVVVDEFSASTVNIKVLFWVDTLDYKYAALELRSNIMNKVKKSLQQNGFGLPANIQEIKLYKAESIPIKIQSNEKGPTQKTGEA